MTSGRKSFVLVCINLLVCGRQAQPSTERWQKNWLADDSEARKALAIFLLAFNRAAGSPPTAKRVPHKVKIGKVAGENRGANPMEPAIELNDDYFWLRDDSRTDKEILGLLQEENAYTEEQTKHLETFRSILQKEMRGYVQSAEDDGLSRTPANDGYEYWSRTIEGSPLEQYVRRKIGTSEAGDVEIIFEWDAAKSALGSIAMSPSGNWLACGLDETDGGESYTILLRDLRRGRELCRIPKTRGAIVWVSDSALFYVKANSQNRPYQVWRHVPGTWPAEDVLVYEESNELFIVDCWMSGPVFFISSTSKETTELHFIVNSAPGAPPTCIRARQQGVRYAATFHTPSRSFFITSNLGGKPNGEVFVATLEAPSDWSPLRAAGSQVLAHSASRSLTGVVPFPSFLVVSGREDGCAQLWVVPLLPNRAEAAGDAHRLAFDDGEDAYDVNLADGQANDKLRVMYSSMIQPPTLLEYDVNSRKYEILGVQTPPNYDRNLYETKRIEVTARDGVKVPVTLLWRPDAVGNKLAEGGGGAPCHMYQ